MTARLAYLMVFIGVLGHASSEFFAVLTKLSGPEVSVWRFMLGSLGLILALAVTIRRRALLAPLREHGAYLVVISLFGVSGTYLAFHLALDFATVVQVGTLVTTIPIFVGLCNLAVNKTPLSTPKIVTGLAAVAGVTLLLTDGYLARLAGDTRSLIGIALAIVCAILASGYAVLAKPLIEKHGALPITTLSMTIGAMGLWLIAGIGWNIWVNPLDLARMAPGDLWPLIVLGLWNTTIAQFTWLGGLAAVPDITRGSYLFFLKPVIAAALALAFLSQPLTGWQMAAILVICGSVVVEMMWPKPR